MRAAFEVEEAIGSLLEAGLIDQAEAERLRERGAATQVAGTGWRVVPEASAATLAGAHPAFGGEASAPAPAEALAPDPYEPLTRGALRLATGLAGFARGLPWRRIVMRGALVALVALVALFWFLLAATLLAVVPVLWRMGLLLAAGAVLLVAGHVRLHRAGDAWGAAALTVGAACTVLAVAAATEPFDVFVAAALAAAALVHVGASYRRLNRFLPVVPVLALPWLVLRVMDTFSVPRVPVLVALTLALLVGALVCALPAVVSPPRRRYAWSVSQAEALVAACFAVLLFLVPAVVAATTERGSGLALGVALLLAATFVLFGLRTRSYPAIAAGLALVSIAPVVFVLVLLGAFGWLLTGVVLGALLVGLMARRSARARAAREDAPGAAVEAAPAAGGRSVAEGRSDVGRRSVARGRSDAG